jgi:hypothetical protein
MTREFEYGRSQFMTNIGNFQNMKAFAIRSCKGGAVIVMNQNKTGGSKSYYLNLDGSSPPNTYNLYGNINMEWTDVSVTVTSPKNRTV